MIRLRELRKKCGLTMKELGATFGVAESTISQYETGKRQPDYELLLRFSEYFGVSVDCLLGADKQSAPPEPSEGVTDDDIKFALFGGRDGVTDEMYDEVKRFAKFIKEKRNDNS